VLEQPGVVRVIRGEPERPEPHQAVLRLRAGGICGSDLAAYRGLSPLVRYPRVLGHELLVDILSYPNNPTMEGQRAVVDPMLPCHACRACGIGRTNCCAHLKLLGVHADGGLRDTFPMDPAHLTLVPDTMSDDLAVLAEPLTVAYQAVQRSGVAAGARTVVLGAGTIGLMIATILRRARGCSVYVTDRDPNRLEVARALGAVPLPAEPTQITEAVAAVTNGDMADAVFEATGSAVCARLTTDLVGFGGTIVLIGWNAGPVEIDTVTLMRKEVNLFGSRNSLHAFEPVLRLLQDGIIDPELIITHRFDLEDAATAVRTLDEGDGLVLKIILQQGLPRC
jgi:L-gulonate 5-dehydrogenase